MVGGEGEDRGWDGWMASPNGHEFEQTLGVDDGQGSLACCSPWGHKESDKTERLNWTEGTGWQSFTTGTIGSQAQQEREIFAAGPLPHLGNSRREILLLAAFLESPRTNSGRGWSGEGSTYLFRNKTRIIKRYSSTHRLYIHSHYVSKFGGKNSLDSQTTTSHPTYNLCIF